MSFSLYNITPCYLSYVQYHARHVWHVKYHPYFFILIFLMNPPKVSSWQFFLFSPHESTACIISHPGIPHYSHTPHISHPHSNPLRIQSIELSYLHIMPRLAKTKKKLSEKEASGDGDGFEAILSVGVVESTSLNMQRKSPTTARTKSKVAGSKKKTSKAATSTTEEPPSPESGGRKFPPEQLVALKK